MKHVKLIIVMILMISLVGFFSCSKQSTSVKLAENVLKAKVTLAMGKAYILRDDNPTKISMKIGDIIHPHDVIITGKNSSVNIVLANRGLIKIQENSHVSLKNLVNIDNENNKATVKVTAGRIVLGLQKLKKDSSFEVETPTAVAGVRGTTFMVSVDKRETSAFPYFVKVKKKEEVVTKIAVLTGKVELVNPKNESDNKMINALREATLENDDFKNIKIEKITRLSLNEISAMKDYSEIKRLKLKEISEEIQQAEPEVEQLLKAELKMKSEIKSEVEDLSQTERAIESQKIEAKKEAIKKMKSSAGKSDGKYLDDQSW